MKNRLRILLTILSTAMLVTASGCTLVEKDEEDDPLKAVYDNTIDKDINEMDEEESDKIEYKANKKVNEKPELKEFTTEGLVSGEFYVRHLDNECESPYIGSATFEGATTQPSSDRVVWFGEDFENIPTLYHGESLILYDTSEFDELFTLERFEDYGYTVGILGAYVTETGRVKIPLSNDRVTTYPGSDADELLQLSNENVTLESIAGKKIREEYHADLDTDCEWLTRSGTLKKLSEHSLYEFVIYDGTIKNSFKLRTDTRVLGSFETQTTVDYDFEHKDVIHINIPEFYHSGFYMINGSGVFRYIAEEDKNKPLDTIDYNIENASLEIEDISSVRYEKIDSENNSSRTEASRNASYDIYNERNTGYENPNETRSRFKVTDIGEIFVHVDFTIPSKYPKDGEGLMDVSGIITSPNGTKYLMATNEDGSLDAKINCTEIGDYIITYKELDIRVPHVTVSE